MTMVRPSYTLAMLWVAAIFVLSTAAPMHRRDMQPQSSVPNRCAMGAPSTSSMGFNATICPNLEGKQGCCNATNMTFPTLSSSCSAECEYYYRAWYCCGSCTSLAAWQYPRPTTCLSSVSRLWEACKTCEPFSASTTVEAWAKTENLTLVDDARDPVYRTCAYPGCRCDSLSTCTRPCHWNFTTSTCSNQNSQWWLPASNSTGSTYQCWDSLCGAKDYANPAYAHSSAGAYQLHLKKVCGHYSGAEFQSDVAVPMGISTQQIQPFNIKCGSVYVDFFCRAANTSAADELCSRILTEASTTGSALRQRLQPIVPGQRQSTVDRAPVMEYWAFFAGALLVLMLCGICCVLAMRSSKERKCKQLLYHHKAAEAQRESGVEPDTARYHPTPLEAGHAPDAIIAQPIELIPQSYNNHPGGAHMAAMQQPVYMP
eukprot:NODE_287_length_1529_cov_350.257432_g208_i0.p1 GENE.NODE_287_length_1529_cov_350.257432_g208_i0~~NODE_287_length_1529_cov_350.257432_g208_i0.p1  ORF type:complete len:428 (-),score=91.41 NODE_287_length_1529_cov_350.257432_g208_i0:129-1412(-)